MTRINKPSFLAQVRKPQDIASKILICIAFTCSHFANAAECRYEVVDEWNSAFKAEISIVNQGDPIDDWALSWQWSNGETLNDGWNASIDCSVGNCTATPPSWFNQIGSNSTFTFGFIAQKSGVPAEQNVTVNGEICSGSDIPANVLWKLDSEQSSLQYVSVKKDHTAEINRFSSEDPTSPALQGSVDQNGQAIFAVDLNKVSTGIDIRNSRLLSLLFETEFLPTAYFTVSLDTAMLAQLEAGDSQRQSITGELSLHGVRQTISADLLVLKTTSDTLTVSNLQPILIDSKSFDMAAGIEALRVVANLSSISEVVPVYFHLTFNANTDPESPAVAMAEAPAAPDGLVGQFDDMAMLANLTWQDNSDVEELVLVRRKPIDGQWQTSAELTSDITTYTEGLPETGEYDYKVIAVNKGVPSLPSNVERIVVTQGNQLVRGQQIFQGQCAGCHGVNGQGIGSFPAINTERNVSDMIDYVRDFMPQGSPENCDQQCAEDVATFIQTLWVTDVTCDVNLTPISYGARQLKILTRSEYQHSVEDLIGVDYDASSGLSADTQVGFFQNNTYAAIVPSSYSNYLLVAEEIAQWSAQQNFAPALNCESFNQDCADSFITDLAPRIFRRPLSEDEVTAYQAMANGSHTQGDVQQGIALALEGMLSSPQFLYRHELGEANPANGELDTNAFELTSYEMATFLAYTYTGSTPDQQLLDAAARDELRDEDQIVLQAQRLAGSAQQVMSDFVSSWLGTGDLDLAAKDVDVWPGFDALVPHMQAEINQTFAHILIEPAEQFESLYKADYSFLNEVLANHYGIDGVSGSQMQKVSTQNRGGILANGAFMARWSEAIETSPILRSVRVRRRMLCQDQPDPPAGTFAAREQKLAELSELLQDPTTTNRLKYHRLTEDSPCTNCHVQYINPLGFGMEDFDSVGRVRTADLNGNPINASGELYAPVNYSDIDEFVPFTGTQDLGNVIANLSSAQSCLPKQMFRFVMGVGHQEIDSDNPEGTQLSDEEKSGYACEIDRLTDNMINDSPRAMLERFGSLKAVRYRKAWSRNQ